MAELATLQGVNLFSVNLTAAAVARGLRLVQDSSNTYSAAGSTVRGDAVAAVAGAASATIAAIPLQSSGIIPVIASGAVTAGDLIYSAASGKVGTSSSSTVLLGKAVTAASGDGVLFEVLLTNPA